MRQILLPLAVVLNLFSFSASLIGQDQPIRTSPALSVSCKSGLPQVRPGEDVVITCDNLPPQGALVFIKGVSDQSSGKGTQLAAVVQEHKLRFRVPDTAQPGLYSVFTGTDPQATVFVPDQLDIVGPPAIDAIYALTNYPAEKGFNFEIAGKNFATSTSTDDNVIEIVGLRILGKCNTESGPPPRDETPCASEIVAKSANELVVNGFYPRHYYGPVKIKVHVSKYASNEASATFAPVSPQGVALAAAFVFFVVAYVLYRLVTKGVKGEIVNGVTSTPWASLFLDRETNSYSLSKFQVIAWTAVTVYSYVYLFLCRTLIQGDFRFPDVSQNLPQLFFCQRRNHCGSSRDYRYRWQQRRRTGSTLRRRLHQHRRTGRGRPLPVFHLDHRRLHWIRVSGDPHESGDSRH